MCIISALIWCIYRQPEDLTAFFETFIEVCQTVQLSDNIESITVESALEAFIMRGLVGLRRDPGAVLAAAVTADGAEIALLAAHLILGRREKIRATL